MCLAVSNALRILRKNATQIRRDLERQRGREIPALSLYLDLIDVGQACRSLMTEEYQLFRSSIEDNIGELFSLVEGFHSEAIKRALVSLVTEIIDKRLVDEPANPALLAALENLPGSPWSHRVNVDALQIIQSLDLPYFEKCGNFWFDQIKFLVLEIPKLSPNLAYAIFSELVGSDFACSEIIATKRRLPNCSFLPFYDPQIAAVFLDDLLTDLGGKKSSEEARHIPELWIHENSTLLLHALTERLAEGYCSDTFIQGLRRAVTHSLGHLPACLNFCQAAESLIGARGFLVY